MVRIGFTCGSWDLLHTGHVLFLKNCRQQCDWLIVGLQTDPTIDRFNKNKPIQSIYERFVQLEGCSYVDEIIPYDTESCLLDLLKTHNFDVRFLGSDYISKPYTGSQICEERGILIQYIERNHDWSSTELRKRIIDASKAHITKTNECSFF